MLHLTLPALLAALLSFTQVFGVRSALAQTISTNDGLDLTLTNNGLISAVTVGGDTLTDVPSAAFRIRDLSDAGVTFSPNLITNPGFEADLNSDGNPDGWTVLLSQNVSAGRSTAEKAEGAYSELFDSTPSANGTGALASVPVPVTPGTTYRLSAQMRARNGYLSQDHTSIGWQHDVYTGSSQVSGIYVQWLRAGGSKIGPPKLVAPMHTNADQWKRITGEVVAPSGARQATLIVSAKLNNKKGENDGLWVDDTSMIAAPEVDVDVPGRTVKRGSGVRFTGTLPAAGLSVEATYSTFPDHLEISGQVDDTTGSDRVFDLVVRLPADLIGYAWWDDVASSRTVAAGTSYSNMISGEAAGFLPISLYPLAALNDSGHALAAALPLDAPQIALLQYADGALEARFKLAISPGSTRLHGSATFSLYVFTFDPNWGMRAALSKMASIRPDWFNSPRDTYGFNGFSTGNFTTPSQAQKVLEDDGDTVNIADAQYTLPEGNLFNAFSSTDPPPSYDAMLQYLATHQSDPRLAALTQSMMTASNGDFVLKQVSIQNFNPGFWTTAWVLNMDPDISDGYAHWIRDVKVDPAFAASAQIGAQLDGVFFDNFMQGTAIDLAPAHIALADHSLTYDPNTYRPGVHAMGALYEFLSWMRDHVTATYGSTPGFSANVWGIGTVNALAPFLDILGNEGHPLTGGNWQDYILRYRRAVAYHKALSFTDQDSNLTESQARSFAETAIFYGIRPGRGANGANWTPAAQAVVDEDRDLLGRYWQLGWEPVTDATIDTSKVRIERFGSDAYQGLDFTVLNTTQVPQSYTLTIDTQAFGLPNPPTVDMTEIRSGAPLSYTTGAGTLELSGTAPPGKTEILRLAEVGCVPLAVSDVRITFRSGSTGDRMSLRGELSAAGETFDFLNQPVSVSIADSNGQIYTATIPAGQFVANSKGDRFKFRDPSGTVASGLVVARFSRKHDGSYKWKVRAKHVNLAGADGSYIIRTSIAVGPTCLTDTTDCQVRVPGKRLHCRPAT